MCIIDYRTSGPYNLNWMNEVWSRWWACIIKPMLFYTNKIVYMFIFFVYISICKYTNHLLNIAIAAYSGCCGCGPLASPQYYLHSSGWGWPGVPALPRAAAPDPSPSLAPELLLTSGPSISASTNPPGSNMKDRASNEPSRRFHNYREGPY